MLTFLFASCGTSTEVAYSYAKNAIEREDYETARIHLTNAARKDLNYLKDPPFILAEMYEKGVGGDTNYTLALKYYKRAFNRGISKAAYRIGKIYELGGPNFPVDTQSAIKWYKKDEREDNIESLYAMGEIYQNQKEYQKAIFKYEDAAKICENNKSLKLAETYYRLGILYRCRVWDKKKKSKNDNVKNQKEKAIKNLFMAANLGHVPAMRELAKTYDTIPWSTDKEIINTKELKRKWYKKAADSCDAEALYRFGRMFEIGIDTSLNWWEAVSYYQAAINHGFSKTLENKINSLKDSIRIHRYGKAQRRVALVIGNSGYSGHSSLKNPVNDAESLWETLEEKLHFKMYGGGDYKEEQMEEEISKFCEELINADVALFYYAGHAVQHGGKVYLLPIDKSSDKVGESMVLENIVRRIKEANLETNIIIIDACRNSNKQTESVYGTGYIPAGFFVAYATQPEHYAIDGLGGKNSPFMEGLLRELEEKDVKINDLFLHVKGNVKNRTKGQQIPVIYNSLNSDDFIFNRSN